MIDPAFYEWLMEQYGWSFGDGSIDYTESDMILLWQYQQAKIDELNARLTKVHDIVYRPPINVLAESPLDFEKDGRDLQELVMSYTELLGKD